jgi:Subtilase family/GEVED domain/Secretion system C-terminal sorting domain
MNYLKSILFIFFFGSVIPVNSQEPGFERGQLLIQFNAGVNQVDFIREYQNSNDVVIAEFVQLSKIANIYLVRFDDLDINLSKQSSLFYSYTEINTVQKNHFITQRETIPNDTMFTQQWFHKNTGQTGGTVDADIDTPEAWDITTGGITTHNDTIVVAIIEGNGVDITHIDLIDNIWHNYAEIPNNGIDDDNNGYVDDFDGWNVSTLDDQVGAGDHGTRVTGMIGATGNNVTGVTGVNWDVKLMIIKGQVASNESSVIAAYDYPLNMRKRYNDSFGQEGAFVVVTNASFGIDFGDPADVPLWCAMYDTLGAYGILNVAATTNNNVNVDVNGDIPTTCSSQYLIGVTMTDDNDVRAGSGYGSVNVDLAAPGNAVTLPYPTDTYLTTNGTSFASPCVAGAIALAYSAPCPDFINQVKNDPSSSALLMKSFILTSVDIIPALVGEVGTNGRLNVRSTLDSLLANCSITTCTPPYNLRDEFITDTTAQLIWDGFSTDYIFFIQGGGNPDVQFSLSNQDSIFFDTLIPCTQYTVRVKGICGVDTSDYSFPLVFTTDGCCNNPAINLDAVLDDQITLSWDSILYATSYDLRYRKSGEIPWLNTFIDTIAPITITGLDTCTVYEFQIKTVCTDSTHGFSPSYEYSTTGCGSCLDSVYCAVIGANDNLEWIDSIIVNGWISKTGPNNGWYESTAVLASFAAGQTYTVVLTPAYSGTVFTERFSIWVDLDQNGVFDPADKLLDNVNTTSQVIDNISIPAGTISGITKMRIGMNGISSPVACPTSSFFGEYEDYCVYIGEDASTGELENNISIFPNPAMNQLNISSTLQIINISVYSYDGKLLNTVDNISNQIDISSLNSGIYILHLQTNNGISIHKFVKQ